MVREKQTKEKIIPKKKAAAAKPKVKAVKYPIDQLEKKEKISFFNKLRLKIRPDRSFLITMMFNNGTSKTFVIVAKNQTFQYRKKMYHINNEESFFNLTQKQYQFFYQEGSAEPINREIQKKGNEKWFSVTPENLKPLLRQEYVKTMAAASELSKFLKLSLLFAGINILVTIALGALMYQLLQ